MRQDYYGRFSPLNCRNGILLHHLQWTKAPSSECHSARSPAGQDVLGHTDITTTLNIYADATRDLKKKEFENLDSFFDNNEESKSIFTRMIETFKYNLSIENIDILKKSLNHAVFKLIRRLEEENMLMVDILKVN